MNLYPDAKRTCPTCGAPERKITETTTDIVYGCNRGCIRYEPKDDSTEQNNQPPKDAA